MQVVYASKAPQVVGPYSQAVRAGELIFISGQIAMLPEKGILVEGGIEEQVAQVLRNLNAVLEAAGSDRNHVLKTTVFLKNLDDYAAMNKVYAEFFAVSKPARAAVEVSRLPAGALIEIEAIALTSSKETG